MTRKTYQARLERLHEAHQPKADREWQLLEPLLPLEKPRGKRRSVDLREIVNGIFYLLHNGCTWRSHLALHPNPVTQPSDSGDPYKSERRHLPRSLSPNRKPWKLTGNILPTTKEDVSVVPR